MIPHKSILLILALLFACCCCATVAAQDTNETQPLVVSTFILDSLSATIQKNINEKNYALVEYDILSYKKELDALQKLINDAGYGESVSLESKVTEYNTLVMKYALTRGFENIDKLVSALQFMKENDFRKADELIASFKTNDTLAKKSVEKLITADTPDAEPFLASVTQLCDDTENIRSKVFQKSELQKQFDADLENEDLKERLSTANAQVGLAAEKFQNTSSLATWTAQKYGTRANILVTGNSLAFGFYDAEPAATETPTIIPTENETIVPEEKEDQNIFLYAAAGVLAVILLIGIFVFIRKQKSSKPKTADEKENVFENMNDAKPAVFSEEKIIQIPKEPSKTLEKPGHILTGNETAEECFRYVADVLSYRFSIENARTLSPRQLLKSIGESASELSEFVKLYEKIHYAESAKPEDLKMLHSLTAKIRDKYL